MKNEVTKLVEIFYNNTFKVFYVNSEDGNTFKKPTSVFVSLGLTTSPDVLTTLRDTLISQGGYDAKIVELKSQKKIGQFLNNVTTVFDDFSEDSQYTSDRPGDSIHCNDCDDKLEELRATIREKKSKGESTISLDRELYNLKEMAEKYRNKDVYFYKTAPENWVVFHERINYRTDNNVDYRIGILVRHK